MTSRLYQQTPEAGTSNDILRFVITEKGETRVAITLYKSLGQKRVCLRNILTLPSVDGEATYGDGIDIPLWDWEAFVEKIPQVNLFLYIKCPTYFELKSHLTVFLRKDQESKMTLIIQKKAFGPQSVQMAFVRFEAESAWLLHEISKRFRDVLSSKQ